MRILIGEVEMNRETSEKARPSSCSNMTQLKSSLDPRVSPKSMGSLSETFEDLKLENLDEVPSPNSGDQQQVVGGD